MNLQNIIDESKRVILKNDENDGIIGLFIGGTVSEKDRTIYSDIDYIGIVNSNFEDEDEKRINNVLRQKYKETEVKLRVLYESELSGGKQRGVISKLIPIKLWIKRFPFFVHTWGENFDVRKTIGPYSCAEEARTEINIIRDYIFRWRNDTEYFHYDWIPKAVMYLCSVESEVEYGETYTISFTVLKANFRDIPDHIIHESSMQRKSFREFNNEKKECYVERVERYLIDLEKKIIDWE